jgi:hypothetical protein
MSQPFLSVVVTVRQPGRTPVRFQIDSARDEAPSRERVQVELIECFAKLKPEILKELGHE